MTKVKRCFYCCCIVGLFCASAMAQDAEFYFSEDGNEPGAGGDLTINVLPGGGKVCVDLYVRSLTGADFLAGGTEVTFNETANFSGGGTLDADCATATFDRTNPFDCDLWLGLINVGPDDCVNGPVHFVRASSAPPPNTCLVPDGSGLYLAEICYDYSADACGSATIFDKGVVYLGDFFGNLVETAFRTLTIRVSQCAQCFPAISPALRLCAQNPKLGNCPPAGETSNCGCDWFETFESYPTGRHQCINGWEGWTCDNSLRGEITTEQDHTTGAGVSIAIDSNIDQVRRFYPHNGGGVVLGDSQGYDTDVSDCWVFKAWSFIPLGHSGDSYLIMLSRYGDNGGVTWNVDLVMDATELTDDFNAGTQPLPLVLGDWALFELQFNWQDDTLLIFYDNIFFEAYTYSTAFNGVPEDVFLSVLDLFNSTGSRVYWDDISMTAVECPTTWYVDDDNCPGPGTGTQGDPFCSIQRAIDESVSGDEVIVAPGTYNETINFNGKGIRLRSSDGCDVTTIDATGLDDTVVRCVSGEGPDTVLEGLTITGGRGVLLGAGMFIQDSSPTVRDCVFRDNRVLSNPFKAYCGGGGMYVANGSPTVTNCQFISNSGGTIVACGSAGGGMYNTGSSPTVTGCTFFANSAPYAGAGMFNYESNPIVTDCVFVENVAWSGAGMYNSHNPSLTVTNCIFKDNVASISGGGGMRNGSGTNLTISNCTFSGNTAPEGGAMYNSLRSPLVTNCVFLGNSATSYPGEGGAISNSSSSPTLTNCTFSGNTASASGGAIFNFRRSSPVLINCSFSGNAAGLSGGVMSSTIDTGCNCTASPSMTNCILWDNTPNQVSGGANAITTITFSDVQGGLPTGVIDGGGNIDADPLFVDPHGCDNTLGTATDNLRIRGGSPCIDVGDNSVVTKTTDLGRNPRIVDGDGNGTLIVDMGSYEFPGDACSADVECDDADVCTSDQCVAGTCSFPANIYGDLDDDGDVDVFDLFCILSGFAGDFGACSFADDDIEPCCGNGVIDIFDLFAVLSAFSGDDPCCGG